MTQQLILDLQEKSIALLALGSVFICYRLIIRVRQHRDILDHRDHVRSPFGLLDVVAMFLVWILGQLAMGQLAATVLGVLFIWSRYRRWDIFGLQTNQIRKDIKLGLAGFVMIVPVVLLIQRELTRFVEYHHDTIDILKQTDDWKVVAAAWFAAVLVAPICEEIFFRVILQGWLQHAEDADPADLNSILMGGELVEEQIEPSSNSWRPVVFSSILFGLVHLGQGPAPIPLFFLGIVLGLLYQRTGSILPSILVHMGLNAFSMFWMTVGRLV